MPVARCIAMGSKQGDLPAFATLLEDSPVDLTSPPATSPGGSPETTAAASPWAVQKQDTYRNSFFIRTVSDWNNLTEDVVSAKSVEEFRSLTSTQH